MQLLSLCLMILLLSVQTRMELYQVRHIINSGTTVTVREGATPLDYEPDTSDPDYMLQGTGLCPLQYPKTQSQ